jgi:hypothetical protein
MAGLITRIIRKIIPQQERRCPACKRTLSKAVNEQLNFQQDCPLEHCAFKAEIRQTILESKTPKIILWNVDKTQILETENIILSWEVLYAKRITISKVGEVSLKGNRTVSPRQNTSYTLTIQDYKDNIYETEQATEVKVYPAPEISDFFVSSQEIIKNSPVKITWITKNIIEAFISINGIRTPVNVIDTKDIYPVTDTEVEIIVIGNLNKEIRKTEKILVHEPAQILSFSVNQPDILETDTITFLYNVANVSKAYLSGSSIACREDVTGGKEFSVIASGKDEYLQTYSLEVYDKINHPLPPETVSINVYPQPVIILFSISKEKILIGDEVELRWDVRNYAKIVLVAGKQEIDVTSMLSYKMNPDISTTYILKVISLANLKKIESEVTVQVFHYIELAISTDRTRTIQTIPVTLHWTVKNSTEVSLKCKLNELDAEYGSPVDVSKVTMIKVNPEKTTLYKIIAGNELDTVEQEILISVEELPKITGIALPELPIFPDLSELVFPLSQLNNNFPISKFLQNREIGKRYKSLFFSRFKDIYKIITNTCNDINKQIFNILRYGKN